MRPREKALVRGVHALSLEELVAVLIGSGASGEQAEQTAGALMSALDHDLQALGKCSIARLRSTRGVGDARAVRIAAAMELGRRRWMAPPQMGARMTRSADIVARFQGRLMDRSEEEFWALALSRSNTAIADLQVSVGGQSGTVVDPKVLFSRALTVRAAALVLVHNHPSGNPRPSEADKALTREISKVGKALDMPVLDHVIIAGMRHFSFADHQLL